ncbi:ribonuclease domain-containing protein [Ornithinimicrobium cerasi]|uniref:Ribonuclease n=1 Tax=Ornithinimicrobium cerasi TaxID=2248773 RepID=A0A285VTK5_9MICO|nr:ribonuclease domain-containing protein [Ornithinimicrobium cerasi]SOC57410.1 ribonuclease [Ornithinimicrobium cerasi]
MRVSRPVAIGLMVVCVLVVLWLAASNLGLQDGTTGPGAAPTTTPTAATPTASATGTTPAEPGGTAYPLEDGDGGPAGTDTRDWDDVDACRDDVLPPELEEVADDVEAGGPFEFPGKDGSTFGNYEGYLPDESRGYYREFTVETPGLDHRGARRIVTGGGADDPEVWYYTDDHYESFCEFVP